MQVNLRSRGINNLILFSGVKAIVAIQLKGGHVNVCRASQQGRLTTSTEHGVGWGMSENESRTTINGQGACTRGGEPGAYKSDSDPSLQHTAAE